MLLEIKNLAIATEGKKIIENLNLTINEGEVHAIMGPNGSGKSTICYGLMGHPKYMATGSVKLNGEEMLSISADQRAKKGLFLAFQNPQQIHGVNVVNILRKASNSGGNLEKMVAANEKAIKATGELGLPQEFVKRDLNVGFSGGEKKRMEILQMKILEPKIAILDEVESGLDVDGLKMAADAIAKMQDGKRAFLLITHFPKILKFVKPDFVHIIVDGKLVKSGKYELALEIEKKGYEQFRS
ncbi:MAG: Fe-S cluster assembly ATPase SufC [Candidatus Micrarchaeia archaeon]|jgi:Fe-S cluster assembly ATP-binding protein